jgi:hypothetical protein
MYKTPNKAKPFPWLCPRCMKNTVQLTTIEYTAKRTRDGHLQTVQIPTLQIPKCGACNELLFTSYVDEQIDEAFRAQRNISVETT